MADVATLAAAEPAAAASLEKAVYRKLTLRLIPFLFICQVVAALDRMNVGYAQLQMKNDLGFSDLIYGTGASMFFLAYFFLEVPSNIILDRIGARKTITRIMFCWGLISAATLFVKTPLQFYIVRLLLGAFEAGFFPGILLYLTYWYPQKRRGQISAYFISAIIVAGMIGGPISGLILGVLDGTAGLRGWQWMFLLEGLPATILGIVAWFYLDDKPQEAKWLTDPERAVILANIEADRAVQTGVEHAGLGQVFRDPKVWVMAFIYFAYLCGSYTLTYWLPIMIKELGVTDVKRIGLLSGLPYIAGLVAMIWYGRRSDIARERRWHFAIVAVGAAIAISLTTFTTSNLWLSITLLTLNGAFLSACVPVFWAVPPAYLSKQGAAVGIALVTCVGQLGGVVSGAFIGWIRDTTGSTTYGLYVMSALLVVAATLMIVSVPVHLLRESDRR